MAHRSVFDRYNIVDEADLRSGVEPLAAAAGTISETFARWGVVRPIEVGEKIRRFTQENMVPEEGIEPTLSQGERDFETPDMKKPKPEK